MNDIPKYVEKFADLMEQNNRGVQIGCYSIAFIGLTAAMRRVRPFSQFKKPGDIPNRFVQERRELSGIVQRIEPNGGLLMVQHKPLLPLFASKGALPVKLLGVDVSGHGISWLQAIVAGNEIKFTPILKNDNFVQCEVTMQQIVLNKKKEPVNLTVGIGESLISVGFGTLAVLDPSLLKTSYYKKLQNAENYALRKKLGVKYYIKPTKMILLVIGEKVNKLISLILKRINSKVPKSVPI